MAGTLTATITPASTSVSRSAAFTGSGGLTVDTMTPVYTMSASLSGAGSLSATMIRTAAITAPLGGSGTLTATDTQKYAVTPSLAGIGALTATVVSANPPITVIGTPVAVEATSITLPTHAIGDIIILGVGSASAAVATKPTASGTVPAWTDINSAAGIAVASLRSAYFVATTTNHTSGTWTNAQSIAAIVLRGQNATPIGGHAQQTVSGPTAATAPAITMTKTDGTSFLLEIYTTTGASTTWSAVPTGYTRRASTTSGSNVAHICMNSKDVTTSDGAIAQSASVNLGASAGNIEILD